MRFLVDECTGPAVARWLEQEGHTVFSIYDEAPGSRDDAIIRKAVAENYILITNDKDFGEKVYREHRAHKGVVFLRLSDERSSNKITVLQRLLRQHAQQLPDQFVVVTEKQIRFAKKSV